MDTANISWNRRKIGNLHSPTFLQDDLYITKFEKGFEYFDRMKDLYPIYSQSKYVPYIFFDQYSTSVKNCGDNLKNTKLSINQKEIVAKQISEFLIFMFNSQIAHRDLHKENICWDGEQIWIIDWESVDYWKSNNIKDHIDYQTCIMSGKDSIYNLVKPIDILRYF